MNKSDKNLDPIVEIKASYDDDDMNDSLMAKATENKKNKALILDSFAENYNIRAENGDINSVIGRDKEIDELIRILSRKTKNNAIIIGETGVGKTKLVEGLALKLVNNELNLQMANKKIYSLNTSILVAGTKYRGQLEERITAILNECKADKNIILFIDEIHTIMNSGGSGNGGGNISDLIKPELTRGDIQIIASTTHDEYRKYISKDKAFERRFQPVKLSIPNDEETFNIIEQSKNIYEDYHLVRYPSEVVKYCVELTSRYITDRNQPDKSFDAIDEVGAKIKLSRPVPSIIKEIDEQLKNIEFKKLEAVKSQKYEEAGVLKEEIYELENKKRLAVHEYESDNTRIDVTIEDIASYIAIKTGIPIDKITETSLEKLSQLESDLSRVVIGQENAVKTVSNAIRLSRLGLSNPDKPITMLFIGKSGVGKTELAKQLAQTLFDNKENMIRLDMSEYSESVAVTKLVGSSNGYVGFEEGSKLINEVRKKPYSVILLDEIEKAHPAVFNTLLQMLGEGRLTDNQGNEANFKNCIILMTSNIGIKKAENSNKEFGFIPKSHEASILADESIIKKEMKNTFSPEFINRIDNIVFFNSLSFDNIKVIVEKELDSLSELIYKMNNLSHSVIFTDAYKEYIANEGYDINMGVRPLKRTITKYGKEALSMYVINNIIMKSSTFTFDYVNNEVVISHKENVKKEKKKK